MSTDTVEKDNKAADQQETGAGTAPQTSEASGKARATDEPKEADANNDEEEYNEEEDEDFASIIFANDR